MIIVADPVGASALLTAQRYRFGAPDFDDPNNSNWTINAAAELTVDPTNNAMPVRRFDDTTEEGVGFECYVPPNATVVTFKFVARANTGPGGAVTVRPVLYRRNFTDNAAVGAWSSATLMTPLDYPVTTTFFQYDEQILGVEALGITPNRVCQFELTRRGTDASDTLAGDWNLIQLIVEFS